MAEISHIRPQTTGPKATSLFELPSIHHSDGKLAANASILVSSIPGHAKLSCLHSAMIIITGVYREEALQTSQDLVTFFCLAVRRALIY